MTDTRTNYCVACKEMADRTVTPMEQIMEMIRKLDERIDDLEYKLRGIMLDD